jgi:hypothetical protein
MSTKRSPVSLRLLTIALGFTALTACTTGVEGGQATTGATGSSTTGAVVGSTTGSSALGSPVVALGGQSGPTVVTAAYPNHCEIDLDFGDVPIGQISLATIDIGNTGRSTLDLQDIAPNLDPEFGVTYGTQPPIQPGGFDQFQVTFETYKVGQVNSMFSIQTDGVNPSCPAPGSVITIQLTGTGIFKNDGGACFVPCFAVPCCGEGTLCCVGNMPTDYYCYAGDAGQCPMLP